MKKSTSMGALAVILCAICLVTALLLGLVTSVTAGPITAINQAKTEAAMNEVLPAAAYDELQYTGSDGQITGIYKAGDAGYVVQVTVSGSQGMIDMVVGVDKSGTATGVSMSP
jgi:Na+-translocating ferredoxin:NAD+ oxidoreductase RnfG subunit